MSFWDEIVEKLFGNKQGNVAFKENFIQKEADAEQVREWLYGEGAEVMEMVYKNYHLQKASISAKPFVKLYNTPYANGFALFYQTPLELHSFSNLFFAFGQRIVDLGYRKVSQDRKIQDIGTEVKTIEKQYFKPPIQDKDFGQKIDQLFGNVSVEKVLFNDKPSYITVLVTVYSDRLYQDAKPFDEFVEQLFNHHNE
ncbi:hypothetical protein KIH41_09320 [Litoribacter ruber]|uniref:hypothetical protein n=1 Tax=Litoribacter ruber TaxID=702568 RepID=UPI001BDB5DD9|nr:hypothetical protein [Litoribacter ruber]MBT0811477.1 hypothetical protein [Litoribacter ruber]